MDNDDLTPDVFARTRMENNVMRHVSASIRHKKRSMKIIVISVVAGLGLAVAGAAVAVHLASTNSRNYNPECFRTASITSKHVLMVGIDDNRTASLKPVADRVDQAISACAAAWKIGEFSGVRADRRPDGKEYPAPEKLTACELPDGRIGVFPDSTKLTVRDFCSNLTLAEPRDSDEAQ